MKVMLDVPAETPVASPVLALIVALLVLLLLHEPLPDADRVVIPPTHTLNVPEIEETAPLTVIFFTV
jgi:hypothetical protein